MEGALLLLLFSPDIKITLKIFFLPFYDLGPAAKICGQLYNSLSRVSFIL